MNLTGKLEFVQEIGSKKDYLPKICPDKVHVIELLEGRWGDVDCTILVHYFLEGKELISKETIEDVDEKNKSITYKLLEGDLMELFKSMKVTFQIISKGEKNFLKWMYEYEKENANGPGPEILKTFIDEVTSRIDEHFLDLKNASLA